jgi:uncharacterized protein YjbI with pentapeptide repeats
VFVSVIIPVMVAQSKQLPIREPVISRELSEKSVDSFAQNDQLGSLRVANGIIQRAEARAVSFDCTIFERTEISSSKLRKASITDVIFRDCLLFGTDFDGSGWLRVRIEKGMHSGLVATDCLIRDVVFESAKLHLVNFRASTLKKVVFSSCDLADADFQGANLTDVKFEHCDLSRVEFSGTKFNNVDLRSSEISAIKGISSLRGATIGTAQLIGMAASLAAELGIYVKD